MYYFMKHLSAFVQPGSVRLGSVTHGSYSQKRLGGRASSVLRGFEATVWPCDSSVRQRWQLTPAGNVMLIDQMTEGFQVLHTGACISTLCNRASMLLCLCMHCCLFIAVSC
jgi:hypothetical protein